MLFVIFGESCTGKSTLAEQVKERLGGEVCTGKDYLRMARSEAEAKTLFREKMARAVTGELETIQARFAKRMGGQLPPPVAAMLEKKHGCFDGEPHEFHVISGETDVEKICEALGSLPEKM